ncbi:rCG25952 [Rattus norvegicus]|uniref:RCG25952 n=1 Tax=Rattus norvegicus TaxID=10116 RepID=A6I246_RAT|nr:rCG25952 [Rattus norvegicus]
MVTVGDSLYTAGIELKRQLEDNGSQASPCQRQRPQDLQMELACDPELPPFGFIYQHD